MKQSRKAIGRDGTESGYVLTNDVNTTPPIPFRVEGGGMIFIPSGYSATSLSIYAARHKEGPYHPLMDSAGTPLSIASSAEGAYPFPADVFPAFWLKLVQNVTDATEVDIITKG